MISFVLGLLFGVAAIVAILFIAKMDRKGPTLVRTIGAVGLLISFILITLSTMTYVAEDKIGIVIKKLGSDLPPGQVIARNKEQGVQADILGPGWHLWYWPWVYDIEQEALTTISQGQVGVVVATDGKPLPQGDVFAPEWDSIEKMADAKNFLATGYKGPQLTVLTPGMYRINTRLFHIQPQPALEVGVGQVAVIKANAGKVAAENQVAQVVNGVPLVPKGFQGIWNQPLPPGAYYLHPQAYIVQMVSTANRIYEYAEMDDNNFNDPILVRSKDGFTFPVDVRVAVSVDAKDAPYMVAILAYPDAMVQDGEDKGRICILEARVVLPVVRTLLRNLAEKLTAFEFVDNRSIVEKDMSSTFKEKMKEFKLTTEGAFIGKIDFDHNPQTKALMQTRTDREVAMNQKAMFEEQEKAQQQRSSLTKATEEAEQQRNLVQSEYQVKVKAQEALARAEEAKGEANYIEITFKARQKAYEELTKVIGKDGTVAMELLKMVGKDKIQICPTVMVSGSDSSGSIMSALAGTILSRELGKEEQKK